MKRLARWVKKNKLEVFLLFLILGLASFFRFYKITETFYFMSDAGRDAQAAYKILVDHKLLLLGPRASVAGFYLGPFYFYLICLPLWIFKMDPLGLAYFASSLGVLSVFCFYLLGRLMFGGTIGLLLAFLYATSSQIVNFSRMAWNPSPVPLLSILLATFAYLFGRTQKIKWLFLSWVIVGLGLQLHYNFSHFIPAIIIFFFFIQKRKWEWLRCLIGGVAVILILNAPLLIFEVRHHFLTTKALFEFLLSGQVGFSFLPFLGIVGNNTREIVNLAFLSGVFLSWKTVGLLLALVFTFFYDKSKKQISFLLLMFLLPLLLFSLFRGQAQLYYYNFLLPFPFLFFGYVIFVWKEKLSFRVILALFLGYFFWHNLALNLKPPVPYRRLDQIKTISASIVERAPFSFNIASFSYEPWYSAEEYRYFTYYFGKRAAEANNYQTIEKLYITSSSPMENPLSVRSKETVDFAARKLEWSWTVGGVWVYELSK